MTQPNNEWQPATTCEGLQRDNILQEILDNIDSYVHGFEGINLAPLKHDVLKKVLEGEFNPEIQIRGLLKTFHHTHEFKAALDQIHSGDLKNKITKFIEGDTKVKSCTQVVSILSNIPAHQLSTISPYWNRSKN